jgi:hypothetical protein
VDEATPVGLAGSAGNTDGEQQKAFQFHGCADQPAERLTARILKHQRGSTVLAHELQRPHRPTKGQLVLQSVLMAKAIEAGGCRCSGRQNDEHRVPAAIGAPAVSPTEDSFVVLHKI